MITILFVTLIHVLVDEILSGNTIHLREIPRTIIYQPILLYLGLIFIFTKNLMDYYVSRGKLLYSFSLIFDNIILRNVRNKA